MNKTLLMICPIIGATIFSVQSATVLIDNNTRNGGFESGTSPPWGGIGIITDDALSHSGSNFGSLSGRRGVVYQFIPLSTADGQQLALTFWARIPVDNGFDSLSVSLSDSGFAHTATVTPLSQPLLSSAEWQLFSYDITIPFGWSDAGNSNLSISFPNSAVTRTAYVDDVTFSQIPEPSVFALSTSLFTVLLKRKRSTNSDMIKHSETYFHC